MLDMDLQFFGGRGGSSGKSGSSSSSSAGSSSNGEEARRLEEKADALEREFYQEMSSTENRHSVGWRRDIQNRISDLRNQARDLKYGK